MCKPFLNIEPMWYFCNSDFLDPKDMSDMELNQQQEIKKYTKNIQYFGIM